MFKKNRQLQKIMISSSYRSEISEQDQDYFIIQDEESNDLFYHYFMQQEKIDVQDQRNNRLDQKNNKELSNTHQMIRTNIQISKKQENSYIEPKNHSLDTDEVISSYIECTQSTTKNNDEIKTEQLSSTHLNPIQNLNDVLKLKRIKRKYQRKNINNKNNILNIHKKSQQTEVELKNAELSKKRAQSKRKGKHSQSKTQKFIHFMTQYHYSKNFYQYFKKKIIEKVTNMNVFQSLSPQNKVEIINFIIPELQQYQMSIHYNVQTNLLSQRFSIQQLVLIKAFFHQIVRKTYKIKFQLQKKRLSTNQICFSKKHKKFFDEKAQQEFNNIFQATLKQEPFSTGLQISFFDCIFRQD